MVSMSVKDSLRRTRFKLKRDFFTIENVVLIIAIALCLMWTYQSITAMSKNWELTETLAKDKRQLELLNIEVQTAELENEYYKTDEYQELLARKLLDKKTSGENMVVMPENSEEAKNKHKVEKIKIEEKEYSNFEKWMMYLFPTY